MKTKMLTSIRWMIFIVFLFSSIAAAPISNNTEKSQKSATETILEDLDGYPCFDGSAFTCVTIEVPLDHFNSDDTRTILVTFAVLPAFGERKGMFVTATGGPGYSGIASADYYLTGFDESILSAFDVVFFDQRGIGYSDPAGTTCPYAAVTYYQQDARGKTPKQEKALKKAASNFSTDCVNEVADPSILPYLGTKQAVEDLEYFRQLIGDEQFWLYGESYGTQYAQTYAASYGEHLAGMILDGTVDLTFDGINYYAQQAQAFNDTLVSALSACNEDPICRKNMLGNAVRGYDRLASQLSRGSISFKFPLANGKSANRKFTLTNLEFVAASQVYNESDRMMFVRALAAYASQKDLAPLARLLYLDMGLDSQTPDVIPDPYYSDAVYYGVECQDYGYPGSSPEDKAKQYLRAADPFESSIPRLASLIYADLPCAYWPEASSDLTRPDYLFAEGIPTLVLGATADPATPVQNGINVYEHLADGYLITQEGGPHVIFGRGNECPDALVNDFLVNDVVPAERETVCDGFVMDDYIPLGPRSITAFQDPYTALSAIETEVYYLPEYYYWDGFTPTSTGCTYGGVFDFTLNDEGTIHEFTLNKCAFTSDLTMTGTGSYDPGVDEFILNVKTSGILKCEVNYTRTGEEVTLTGQCGGKPTKEHHVVEDQELHKAPDLNEPKEDH